MPETLKAFAAEPYSYTDVRAVAAGVGVSEPVAVTLVRRGYRTPELARAFLAADESHPPAAFGSMAAVVGRVLAAIEEDRRITVHGDFDVDGVCATAIAVSNLRELGAECDWLIPDRLNDGYGLSEENVRRLAERGTQLLITVDCGVTAVEQVRLAQQLGMEVIVTDHHQAGPELPNCLLLHPELDGYPFASLCGTAVSWKLACALREAAGVGSPETPREGAPGDPSPAASPEGQRDLDLVALATVADVVPLVGENRALVKRGLAELRRARRPGLRALMEASKCEPSRLDEGDLAFRLAPRINAAGRLYRADAGVELLLSDDEGRCAEIAAELGRANAERRATEREVDNAAEAALRALPEHLREAPGLVLAGPGWHPGVVGIVASRLVERHHRPVVAVSLDGEGGGRGSGRSIPGFDLHAALDACSEHLVGFGGHRAAAGLNLREEDLEAFREAFAAHAAATLSAEDLRRTERIDAVVGGLGLGLELAEELGQLAPFGMGNPGVRLMVPSARVGDVRAMGEGKHARFSLHSGGHRALGVAFGRASLGVGEEDPVDAAVRLEVNHWNGAVEPRVVLRELYPLDAGGEEASPLHACHCEDSEWWRRFEVQRGRGLSEVEVGGALSARDPGVTRPGVAGPAREVVGGARAATAAIAELVSSGAGVLAVCADASRRAALAGGASGLARFNGGAGRIACQRCGGEAATAALGRSGGGLALVDYPTLAAHPELAAAFEHIVLVDPPSSPADERLVAAPYGPKGAEEGEGSSAGFLHPVWTEAERGFALAALGERLASREAVTRVFRALRGAVGGAAGTVAGRGEGDAGVSGDALREALGGGGSRPLAPEAAARCFRVLEELGLLAGEPAAGGGSIGVVSSAGTELDRSGAFRAYRAEQAEAQRFLERPKQP